MTAPSASAGAPNTYVVNNGGPTPTRLPAAGSPLLDPDPSTLEPDPDTGAPDPLERDPAAEDPAVAGPAETTPTTPSRAPGPPLPHTGASTVRALAVGLWLASLGGALLAQSARFNRNRARSQP